MATKKTSPKKKQATKAAAGKTEKSLIAQVRLPTPASDIAPILSPTTAPATPVIKTPAAQLAGLADKDAAIRAWMNSTNSKETRRICTADDAPNTYTVRRPTGIMELDIDLGGGWPAGGTCFLGGPDNVGKSHLVFRTLAMQQKLYGNACRIAYGVTEGGFPFDQALKAGVKVAVPDKMLEEWQEIRRQRGIPLYTKEQLLFFKQKIGELYLIAGTTGEETLSGIVEAVRTNAFSLIACDSLQGLMPAANLKKEMTEEERQSAHANMMKKFWTQYVPLTTVSGGVPNYTTVLFTNQVRANKERANLPSYMQQYIPDWIESGGGHASKHFKLVQLVLNDTQLIKKGEGADRTTIGKVITWRTEKGKAGTHDNKTGEVSFYYQLGGPDIIGELLTSGIRRGVIQQRGQQVVVVQPDTKQPIEELSAPNPAAMRKMIEADFEFELAVRREILTAAGIQCLYR